MDANWATNTVLLSGAAAIYSISIVNTNAANCNVYFYDSYRGGLTNMSNYFGPYTNYSKLMGSQTNTWTTAEGVVVTNIITGYTNVIAIYPTMQTNKPVVKTIVAIADATTEKLVARQVVNGLSAFCLSNLTITVSYEQRR